MTHKKINLTEKDCLVCGRPFSWRKKWERCWDEVKYCSERCRRHRKTCDKVENSINNKQGNVN